MDDDARELRRRGFEAWDAQDWPTAADCFEQVLAAYPDGDHAAGMWYDAALAYKFLRNWDKAYELGVEAAARAERGTQDPAFWNLGIAATVKRRWRVARDAWRGYGIDAIEEGDDEIVADFGRCCVRLESDGDDPAEVVWVQRICPTRARIVSVPFGSRRFGEVVVHDGEPKGRRTTDDGGDFPVFEELLRWQDSPNVSWHATVDIPDVAAIEDLVAAVEADGLAVEPATPLLHRREESEASVELPGSEATAGVQDVVLAAPDAETAARLLDAWAGGGAGRSWRGLIRQELHRQGRHTLERYHEWPFPGGTFPRDLAAVVHKSIASGERPALMVFHDAGGDWSAVDGVQAAVAETATLACMDCLTRVDPSLAGLADLPPGWMAERTGPDAPWVRLPHQAEDDAEG